MSCLSCTFAAANHGRRFPSDLLREEPRRRPAAAAAGGGLPPLHAVAEHGIAQPVGQVLREFSLASECFVRARVWCSTICLNEFGAPVRALQGDRFIPDRSAMDMDMAHYLLTEPRKDKENAAGVAASPSKEAYRRLLAEKLLNNRTRILAFRNKPPEPENVSFAEAASNLQVKPAKQRRHIPQVCTHALPSSYSTSSLWIGAMGVVALEW